LGRRISFLVIEQLLKELEHALTWFHRGSRVVQINPTIYGVRFTFSRLAG